MKLPQYGHLSVGGGKTEVNLRYFKFFNTLFVYLYGGKPHIGAATAYLTVYSKKLTKTLRVPGHRDDVVTKKVVSILSKKIRGAVFVVAGIHYDNATRRQIQSIVRNCCQGVRSLVD